MTPVTRRFLKHIATLLFYLVAQVSIGQGKIASSVVPNTDSVALLQQGPILDLSFGNEILDNSGRDYHGISPTPLKITGGPYGPGVVIGDNANDAVFIPGESINGLGDFTITFYVKLNGLQYHNNIISCANDKTANELIVAYNDLSDIKNGLLLTYKSQMHKFPRTEGVLSDLQWHKIVLIRSDNETTALIDGKVKGGTITISDGLLDVAPNGFVIGQDQDAIGGSFDFTQSMNGAIGELKIYDYAIDVLDISPTAYSACALAGTSCDDGDLNTLDDKEDGQCNCAGTPELISIKALSQHRASKNRYMTLSLISMFVIGLGAIYFISHKRRRDKINLEKRHLDERVKRESVEKELEYKKKELTAKALQLASKNDFLQSLEQEIGTLQSSIDGAVGKTTQRISRMINNDQLDDTEWDQFGKEFSSIHQAFMDELKAQYGDFSNTEWRLISLMKMNLSSKDIANILRISPDGVKKARYRLRKKMDLASEVDIQDYLISYRV